MMLILFVAGKLFVVDAVGDDACVEIVSIVRPINQNNVWTTGVLFF
jgi:hypothetical protein